MTRSRRAGVLAGLAFLLLCFVSADAWSKARQLQWTVDRSYAVRTAQHRLHPLALTGSESTLRRALDQLQRDPALGFRFLALRDAHGIVRVTTGRYEQWSLEWLSADVTLQLRELLYALTSTHETVALGTESGAPLLEFALGAPEQRAWHEEVLSRLLRFSVLGFLTGASGLLALFFFLRQREPLQLSSRTPAPLPAPPIGADHDLMGQAGLGLIQVSRAQRIQSINSVAEALTAWKVANALDQQVFSVVHLRNDDGQPLDPVVGNAWQAAAIPLHLEGWLQPRQGARRRVDITVASLRDAGGLVGGVLLLQEAGSRHAEREKLARAAHLPQSLMDRLEEVVLHTDSSGIIRYANRRLQEMLGYAPEELKGESIGKLLPVPFLDPAGPRLIDYAGGAANRPAVVAWHKNGTQITVGLVVETLPVEDGLVVMLRPKKT